jgi:isoleucyl-tRNA synthetase
VARFPEPAGIAEEGLGERWEALRSLRDAVNKCLEEARQGGLIGKSLEASILLTPPDRAAAELCRRYEETLPALFIVSRVELRDPVEGAPVAEVKRAEGEKCTRCWTVTESPRATDGGPLCPRCAGAVKA